MIVGGLLDLYLHLNSRFCCSQRPAQRFDSSGEEMVLIHSAKGDSTTGFKARVWAVVDGSDLPPPPYAELHTTTSGPAWSSSSIHTTTTAVNVLYTSTRAPVIGETIPSSTSPVTELPYSSTTRHLETIFPTLPTLIPPANTILPTLAPPNTTDGRRRTKNGYFQLDVQDARATNGLSGAAAHKCVAVVVAGSENVTVSQLHNYACERRDDPATIQRAQLGRISSSTTGSSISSGRAAAWDCSGVATSARPWTTERTPF